MKSKHKFGSIEWQDEMLKGIEAKEKQMVELEPYEKTFLEVQGRHNARIMYGDGEVSE